MTDLKYVIRLFGRSDWRHGSLETGLSWPICYWSWSKDAHLIRNQLPKHLLCTTDAKQSQRYAKSIIILDVKGAVVRKLYSQVTLIRFRNSNSRGKLKKKTITNDQHCNCTRISYMNHYGYPVINSRRKDCLMPKLLSMEILDQILPACWHLRLYWILPAMPAALTCATWVMPLSSVTPSWIRIGRSFASMKL